MNCASDEAVTAYVDGGMDKEALAEFEARLAKDPLLAKRVTAHHWITRQIVLAYGSPPQGIVDDALIARLGLADAGSENIVSMSGYRRASVRSGIVWTARIGLTAASLVLGIFVGQTMFVPHTGMIVDVDGRPIASGALAAALSNQLAGEQGAVRIGITFRTHEGICRTFRTELGTSGLGCREGTHWRVPMMTTEEASDNTATEYRLASGDVAPSIMAEVDRRIKGEALSPVDEVRLRASHWQ